MYGQGKSKEKNDFSENQGKSGKLKFCILLFKSNICPHTQSQIQLIVTITKFCPFVDSCVLHSLYQAQHNVLYSQKLK